MVKVQEDLQSLAREVKRLTKSVNKLVKEKKDISKYKVHTALVRFTFE